MKENIKSPLSMTISNKPKENTEVSAATYLKEAQENFPKSQLISSIAKLPESDIEMLDHALNRAGENFASFGSFEEDADAEEIIEILNLLKTFGEVKEYDAKRTQLQHIATRIKS